MPTLNWDVFTGLPGSAEANFEFLCRALIRRHYARYGTFAAVALQPGVEFHLRLTSPCSLGESGRWYGWQCRWYDLPGGRALGSTRKRKIAEALATTQAALPHLTDWVLWTRRTLTAGDQTWFYGLTSGLKLHLWTAAEVEEHLVGDGALLRAAYFDELILTREILASLHNIAVSPIKRRWLPDVHEPLTVEVQIRQMLGERSAWASLWSSGARLVKSVSSIQGTAERIPPTLRSDFAGVLDALAGLASFIDRLGTATEQHGFNMFQRLLPSRPEVAIDASSALIRVLRAREVPVALPLTNAVSDAIEADSLLDDLSRLLVARVVTVSAEAGCGKTQLSAALTAEAPGRPAGILLHGRELVSRGSLDDLAGRIVVHGAGVKSMDALLAAVDAAGERMSCRLPIVIDALNESEDPRDWKRCLAPLSEHLSSYPHVLLVCTVRTGFVRMSVPDDFPIVAVQHLGEHTAAVVRRYFKFYKIRADDASIPLRFLRHPLTLRFFCDVVNPSREYEVGIEAFPGSLSALFEKYLALSAERIVDLAPRPTRFFEQDVRSAFHQIGLTLWNAGTRDIDESELRRQLNDFDRPWGNSLLHAMEQEGVFLRVQGSGGNSTRVAAAYDLLAGYIIADSLLREHGGKHFLELLKDDSFLSSLTSGSAGAHPLASDTFWGLVALVPRRLHREHLWTHLQGELRTAALRAAAELEGTHLDAVTVSELGTLLIHQPSQYHRDLLYRLWETRGSPEHPLNSEFLDRGLRPLHVADRDLRWTQWLWGESSDIVRDLSQLAAGWRAAPRERALTDRLKARWVMWTLTSTVRLLRDQATNALYWFGRGDPAALFHLASESFELNDNYITERMLAASYGVLMAHPLPAPTLREATERLICSIWRSYVGDNAKHPTDHWLIRLYVNGIASFIHCHFKDLFPSDFDPSKGVPFAHGHPVDPLPDGDSRAAEVEGTLQLDFENYTLGTLCPGRAPYESHPLHDAAVAQVRGFVWALGWRKDRFEEVERSVATYTSRSERAPVERYGKKYGWIGYYNHAGRVEPFTSIPGQPRLSELQIDPSFPEPLSSADIQLDSFVSSEPKDDKEWLRKGKVSFGREQLAVEMLSGHVGPWVLVHGFLRGNLLIKRRHVFGFITAFIVEQVDESRLTADLNARKYPGNSWLPEAPADHYTFAGEIPWSPAFAAGYDTDDSLPIYQGLIRMTKGPPVAVEVLAHRYSWESYHSTLNRAGGALIPSKRFSHSCGLRGMPQNFAQCDAMGRVAALSVAPPEGFTGDLLYLRRDVLQRYLGSRRLILFAWGEREVVMRYYERPKWIQKIHEEYSMIWRAVHSLDQLSSAATSSPRGKRHRDARR